MKKPERKIQAKLKSRRGETLVETLCAILVLALSAGMLGMLTNAAARITRDTALANALLYQEVSVAEQRAGKAAAEITVTFKGGETLSIKDARLTGGEGKLYSFALPEKEGE